ncbi:MAG TPA: crosslink repair DNA glycosylase YcaQ family protein [Polyangiaceae bacterium]|nr:crosslink repair DNA glycosylase YcaQ family protein [Polyangiaceae bacterium]
MNQRTLIDGIVRQTVVLIAELATAGGIRAPLAHVAEQVFVELAQELERQGVTQSVSADMFGMALRTYQRRTERLERSETDRGRSLWEAVFEHVRQGSVVSREDVFKRFRHDDEVALRAVLRDLTESGLVFSSGKGRNAVYRLATEEELGALRHRGDRAALDALVWSIVFREGPLSLGRLAELCRLPAKDVEPVVDGLVGSGRLERVESGGKREYRSRELVLGFDDPAGWEAAVLDHFSAVVRTIARKLALTPEASAKDEVGGSTYHFVLWRGHPMEEEILGELRRFRERQTKLRDRLDRYNEENGISPEAFGVTAYFGQCPVENDDAE